LLAGESRSAAPSRAANATVLAPLACASDKAERPFCETGGKKVTEEAQRMVKVGGPYGTARPLGPSPRLRPLNAEPKKTMIAEGGGGQARLVSVSK